MKKCMLLAVFSLLSLVPQGPLAQVRVVAGVRVAVAPPRPRVERVLVAPSHSHHWIAGHWVWRGSRHVWFPGRWMLAPVPGYVWEPAHWEQADGGWMFYEGHWRPADQPDPVQVYQPPPPPPKVVVARRRPPPPPEEVQLPPPFEGAVWLPGYWHWHSNRHIWVAGRWSPRHAGDEWRPPRWERRRDGRYVHHPGRWHRH